MDIQRLRSQLAQAEGKRLTAYKDSLGFWTAGVGHLLPQDRDWTGVRFTEEQVNEWLEADIAKAATAAGLLLEWPYLDVDARQNAVIELVFNMGLVHWKGFAHTRMCLSHKDWQGAHDGLLNSLWAKQVGPTRSNRIANQLLVGEFA